MPKKETEKVKQLDGIVKRYVENNDYFTAKSYVKSWGSQIEGYPVDIKLQEIEKLEKKQIQKKED